jgi:hypothetical protein
VTVVEERSDNILDKFDLLRREGGGSMGAIIPSSSTRLRRLYFTMIFSGMMSRRRSHVFWLGHRLVEVKAGQVDAKEHCAQCAIVEWKRSLAVSRSAVGVLLLP